MDAAIRTFQILILLFSVVIHEVMHGVVALKFGDHTAEDAGRLTLNPIPHIDPIGSILMPILSILGGGVFFAWAKPVPVNPLNFRDMKRGELYVSLAGIGANFGLALLGAVSYHLLFSFLGQGGVAEALILIALQLLVVINLMLGVFNLIPIPPLDGSKVLMTLLPYEIAKEYMKLERYGFLILLVLLLIPIGGQSIITLILGSVVRIVTTALGIPF